MGTRWSVKCVILKMNIQNQYIAFYYDKENDKYGICYSNDPITSLKTIEFKETTRMIFNKYYEDCSGYILKNKKFKYEYIEFTYGEIYEVKERNNKNIPWLAPPAYEQ